jgi:hypothetical protein
MASGVVIGALLLIGIRFALQEPPHAVHFHANWALMVDGQRVDLTAQRYMVDVLQCTIDPSHQAPEDRVHMHEGNHDIVHVHASGVTWGHFLANLGFGVGDDYLQLRDEMLRSDSTRTLKFVLNGNRVRSIRNLAVGDQDRLLISFGTETLEEVVANQFPTVAQDAGEYNTRPDPASCSGAHEETFGERLRRAAIGR